MFLHGSEIYYIKRDTIVLFQIFIFYKNICIKNQYNKKSWKKILKNTISFAIFDDFS